MTRRFAIITKAKAPYYKPLYEAVAASQPDGWETLVVWPAEFKGGFPKEHVTPVRDNLCISEIKSFVLKIGKKQIFLPSRQAWKILFDPSLHVILIHELSPYTLQALIAGKLRRIPVILSTEVGKRNAHFFPASVRYWHRYWGKLADGIVACSPAAHEPLGGRRIPSVAAYHAMDSRDYVTPAKVLRPDGKVVFAYLGQLIHRKGLDLFLAAAAALKSRHPSRFLLRFIGGGEDAKLRADIASHGLEEYCELSGFLSGAAIRETLGEADVFVLPTREDTYAAVVHEAACLGLPLLISKYAGASEALVENGVNGYVFDPEDCESFTRHLERFMNADLRQPMAISSLRIAENHSAHRRGEAIWSWMTNHGFV
ncbi:MAG: glycosyltransferase [Verrucomicrobiaceae bacterium]|nr:MAG: glycosyltransferase [Verrucomicrobiaceae bacterium]